jgi:hypothetical protein
VANRATLDGSEAGAGIACQLSDVIAIYPIRLTLYDELAKHP